MAEHLPANDGDSVTLYLKETATKEGYDLDDHAYPVVITKTVETYLDEETNTYITKTTYGITIDSASSKDVTNTRKKGDLVVSKTVVSDAAADKDQTFQFTITLSDTTIGGDAGKTYGDLTFKNGIATFELKGGENKKATDLPTGITYTVTEAVDQNFEQDKTEAKGTISENESSAAFTNTRKVGNLVVSKKVVSDATADKDQEFEFTITLSDNTINGTYGEMTFKDGVATIELKGGESATAEGLPTGITYIVEETSSDDFDTESANAEGKITVDGCEAEFTNTRKLGDLEVSKELFSNVEADKELAFEFTVTLTGAPINGQYGDMTFTDGVAVVNLKGGESATAEGLPTGVEYEVTETANTAFVSEANGEKGTVVDGKTLIEFTNTRKTGTYEIEITKKMEGPEASLAPDGDYVFKLTPVDGAPMPDSDEVIVSLKKGEITGSGKFGEITYDECGEYTYEITEVPGETLDMKYSKEKVVVTVTVTEGDTELEADASYQDGIDALVNYYDSAKVSVAVKKLWKDENNSDGLRPTGLKMELLADGELTGKSVNLNADNNWVGQIDQLPKRKDGKEIVYTWKEPNVVGYTLTGTSISGSLTTLTNTHEAEKTTVEVKKVWVDDGEHPADVEVQLYADGKALGDAVKLNAGNGWKYSWNNLCRNVRDDGVVREIKYTVAETKIPEGYVAKITGNASAGFVITNTKGTGKLVIEKEFDILIPEEEPEEEVMTTDIEIVKIWDDNNNADGNRPKSITVHLYAGGEEVRNAKLTAANGWKHTFGELPKFVNGHPITYTVKEDPVRWYVAEIHGYTIRNKYQPEMTSVSVRKVWDDENNKHMFRPTSVLMTLSNGMSVILSEENGWMASITGLPTMVNGKPAEYTWTEQEVIGYELESMVTEGTVTTFTNKPWSRPDKPTEGKTPRLPGEEITIEEYETPLGVDVIINHVGDCFD